MSLSLCSRYRGIAVQLEQYLSCFEQAFSIHSGETLSGVGNVGPAEISAARWSDYCFPPLTPSTWSWLLTIKVQ